MKLINVILISVSQLREHWEDTSNKVSRHFQAAPIVIRKIVAKINKMHQMK